MRALRLLQVWDSFAAYSRRCGLGGRHGSHCLSSFQSATYADKTSTYLWRCRASYHDLSCVLSRGWGIAQDRCLRGPACDAGAPAARGHRPMSGALSVLPVADCSTAHRRA